ncbi:PucR family transcriptional regulator ligand-binding domain-containing protein [Bacillus sp. V5-8f]|uniref:PucR family transcriptional regulator n=1 Tax=Bacillus sp. V5-8f TaxID=2053044 RepID=UPI000C76A04A|nr:PucR family transcriptional regulator ligand-binding domain-containing protein [Bacillus sp. V5-8f]PLT35434.1 PucR family transcriptional regulator [Bacillus sp. V5-8f]
MKSFMTIEEILRRKYFDKSEMLAGKEGKKRLVKWVHVVESTQITHLLNGNELILTTGLGWKDDETLLIPFIKQLINTHAAGLCIEIGTHISKIPQDVIILANHYNFPIILFHQEVPFVEITHDLHSVIINKQYLLISSIESYSQELNKMLLEVDHYDQILKFLQNYLEVQVLILFNNQEFKACPNIRGDVLRQLIGKIQESENLSDPCVSRQSIQILGEAYAELAIFSKQRELNEFDLIILDRTATALAQHFLRDLYVEEKKNVEEGTWIRSWLDGEHSDEAIRNQLSFSHPRIKLHGAAVCICKLPPATRNNAVVDRTYFKLLFRTVFEQAGFLIFPTEMQHHLIFIMGDKRSPENWKDRMADAFERIINSERISRKRSSGIAFGVGKYVTNLGDLYKSYKTAKEALVLQDKLTQENKSYFYQDLHMYRILSLIKEHSNLEETVKEYLEPVILYDKQFNGELMVTLKTYLRCNGSKQETSRRLFIVRQTLYHRLEKLEKLLGKDFMQSERRLAIEFMVLAHDYLLSTKKEDLLRYEI